MRDQGSAANPGQGFHFGNGQNSVDCVSDKERLDELPFVDLTEGEHRSFEQTCLHDQPD
jgi:hypothetical protein